MMNILKMLDPEVAHKLVLWGLKLFPVSTQMIQTLRPHLEAKVPLVGVGGITTPANALEMLDKGASALQLYTAMALKGPKVVTDINKAIRQKEKGPRYDDIH
jgi:dihydroorotate dehydrogenase